MLYRGGFYRGGARPHERDRRHRPGAVGHQGQGARRAGPCSCSAASVRDRIRVYSWIGGDRPADVADDAHASGRARLHGGEDERHRGDAVSSTPTTRSTPCVETSQTVRDAVGPDIGIGVDFHGRVHKPMAKVLAKELEPFKLMFIEEPVLSEHAEALKEIANHSLDADRARRAAVLALGLQAVLSDGVRRHHPARSVATPAASPNAARSPRWPRPTTSRWRCTARSGRSRSPRACSSTRSAYNAFIQEQSLGIHYNKGNDLLDYIANKERVRLRGRLRVASRRGPGSASRSTRTTSSSERRKATAGATRSGATPTAASPSGKMEFVYTSILKNLCGKVGSVMFPSQLSPRDANGL